MQQCNVLNASKILKGLNISSHSQRRTCGLPRMLHPMNGMFAEWEGERLGGSTPTAIVSLAGKCCETLLWEN